MKRASSWTGMAKTCLAIAAFVAVPLGQAHAVPGYEIKNNTFTVAPGNHTGSSVFCTMGKKVLGGGFDIQGSGPSAPNYATRSQPAGTQNGWDVNVRNNGTVPVQVKIFAVCAT